MNYNQFGYPTEPSEQNLTEIRQTRDSDLAILHAIEIKCHENPMDKDELNKLMKTEQVHGILGILRLQNAGFALFNIQDHGSTVFINRFSVSQTFVDAGVVEKIISSLRATISGGPPADLRMVVSENDIGTPMFNKLLDQGFVGTGTIREAFFEYSREFGTNRWFDGIKLELVGK